METQSITSDGKGMPPSWRRAVVRVWCGSPREKGQYLGTAFLVSSDNLLTAFHVVDVGEARKRDLTLEGPAFEGGLRAVTAVHPEDDADLAMLVAPTGLSASPETWIPWSKNLEGLNREEKLILVGYGSLEMAVETATAFVRSEDGTTGNVMLSGPVAKGMSGGPAFAAGRLAGVILANDSNAGRSYVLPISRAQRLLERFAVPPAILGATNHPLQAYPLFVPFGVEFLNPGLWKAYARIIPLGEEDEVIYKADSERLAADPGLDEAFLLHDSQLPDPAQNRQFFWKVAFQTALRRSGRMLAALLLAVDESRLPPEAVGARRDLLEALRQQAKK